MWMEWPDNGEDDQRPEGAVKEKISMPQLGKLLVIIWVYDKKSGQCDRYIDPLFEVYKGDQIWNYGDIK